MSIWLWAAVYVAGYLTGVAYALKVARRSYADKSSALWDYHGEKILGDMAVLCGLGVLLLPLLWPIAGIGLLGWHLVARPVDNPSPMPEHQRR